MKNKHVEIVIRAAGSQSELARIVGHPQSLVSAWLLGKRRVSVDSVPLMVEISDGAVQPYQLRPDLPAIFPHPTDPKSAA
ncbi:transcriptional regulator [Pantoea ananatis]|uniref:transcriptional regulator n=1 Tax=Pantoea ananas TaxID=553 RepID=UPI002350EC5E|nr:YdaS family helix-turn-helix protein [Pantoea ananatis]